jgi:hypothetical protein
LHPLNPLRSLTASLIVIQSGIPSLMFRQVELSDIIHLLSHNDIADKFLCVFERCLKF